MTTKLYAGDVMSVATGRLLCSIDGVYKLLEYLTGEPVYTHQIPRFMREAQPWIRAQYPQLWDPDFLAQVKTFCDSLVASDKSAAERSPEIAVQVNHWCRLLGFPDDNMLPVEPMDRAMHTSIDPVEELSAMVGDDKVIVIDVSGGGAS